MLIKISTISLNIEVYSSGKKSPGIIFFFHGFTGSLEDWKQIIPSIDPRFKIISVDLIGHGKSDSPNDVSLYSAKALVEQTSELIKKFGEGKIILSGYSMGARAALLFAVKHPEMLEGLILESASAGIKEKSLRIERAKSDQHLAEYIESHPIEEFVDYWMNMDLFDSQKNLPKEKFASIRNSKLKNSQTGLANSLRGFSTGKMPFLYDKITKVKCRTLLITGELDKKYTLINSEMLKKFPAADHQIIKNAGHNTHLEKPKDFARILNSFLSAY